MENWDARLFQHEAEIDDYNEQDWNIVELKSRRHLRRKINELIHLTTSSTLTTSDLLAHLHSYKTLFGSRFILHLVRALHYEDQEQRQAVVWLLAIWNDKETVAPLQQIAQNERLSRSIRLSASLALAGMGETREMKEGNQRRRLSDASMPDSMHFTWHSSVITAEDEPARNSTSRRSQSYCQALQAMHDRRPPHDNE